MFSTTTSIFPSLSRSPKAAPRLGCGIFTGIDRQRSLTSANVPSLWFRKTSLRCRYFIPVARGLDLRIHMSVHHEQISPAVVVEIDTACPPAHDTES